MKTSDRNNINNSSSISNILFLKNKKTKNNNKNEKYNDYEINSLPYKEAIKIDKRTYIEYYLSLLRTNQLLIFAFYIKNDYNSRIIKICLFLFSFSLSYAINALFFNDSTFHIIYKDQGIFNIIYQLPQILYSSLISNIILIIIKYLSLSQYNILEIKYLKNNIKQKSDYLKKCLKIKFILFFIIELLFLFLFWYYLSCFCIIYKNTQIYLLKDTIISFVFFLLYPIFICLLPGIFRISSLKLSNKECLYRFSKLLQLI